MAFRTSGVVALGLLAAGATAQTPSNDVPFAERTSPQDWLDGWRSEHGPQWRLLTSPKTGRLEFLHGGSAAPDFAPDTSDPLQWFELARTWIERTRASHGVEPDQLGEPTFRYLPLAQGNTTDKITVAFPQVVNGLPVEGAMLNVLFDTQGRLLSIHSTAAPDVVDAGAEPTFGAGFAGLRAAAAFRAEIGVAPTWTGDAQLMHAWVDDGETRRYALSYQVEVLLEDGAQPIGRRYTIDAQTREVLKSVSTVHNFDVFGTVTSFATPGQQADSASNPPAPIPMPRVRVASSAGTVETDASGNFTITGVNTPVDVTLTYFGEFTNVNNDAGADYSITITGVQPNVQNDLVMNPSPTEFVTSQANTQLHINGLRDWIVSRFPTDSTADFRAVANTNINDACNAFFTTGGGGSVNFFNAAGGCNNTAFSSVIAHEMGHWLNVLYGTGNGSDGMGEGNADIFSMYYLDDPIVGRSFTTGGGSIRNGNNTRQFCGDSNPGCYGGVHADGEVWMGAAWKIRRNLNQTLGGAQGDLVADLLFLGWMNGFNQTQIRSIIEAQWLTLDDDDGNIDNGTPNYDDIDGGFTAQGFPGYELPFVTLTGVTELGDTTDLTGPYTVNATVTANLGTNITGAVIEYTVNGGAVQSIAMTNTGGTQWTGAIPGPGANAVLRYWVTGSDDAGHTDSAPEGAPLNSYLFTAGVRTDLYVSDFEPDDGGFTGGAAGDTATTGIWVHGNPNGTAAQPEDDRTVNGTQCWFTGQASPGSGIGTNDVDGGITTLLSPVFDASAADRLLLSYSRWYSNTEGNAPGADVFDVGVSNDGGSTWTLLERVGPTGDEVDGGWFDETFDLTNTLTPTTAMQVRFVAKDLGDGSIVEAAIDEVSVVQLGSAVNPPSNYCVRTINSTGAGAQMLGSGSQSIAANNFLVAAVDVPPGVFGLFFFGPSQTDVPLTGSMGRLCVGGSLNRLPVVQSDPAFGYAFYNLDFTDPSTTAQFITAGSTWNFQLWFRDVFGGQPTSNTTDGLSVVFTD